MIETLRKNGFVCDEDYTSPKQEVQSKLHHYHGVVIRSRFVIDREFIDAGKQLKVIGRAGAGMENINVSYAASKGITCVHAPEGNRVAVAEHALGMLLALMNNFRRADNEVRNATWKREANRGTELTGKTVAIIGFGNTGSAFAKVLQGFDVKILAYDKYKANFGSDSVKESNYEEIFCNADVISFHVPLSVETKGMVNEKFLSSFTKPIWLLNTSRGPIVDTTSLVSAIEQNKIIGAGLDVLEYESISFENLTADQLPEAFQKLRASDRVILSPHVAGWTHESHVKIAQTLADKISAALTT